MGTPGRKAHPNPGVSTYSDEIASKYFLLFKHAIKLTWNRAQAEDLTQEVILRAIERQHQFRPGSNLDAWLFTIMNNQYNVERRRMKLFRSYSEDDIAYLTVGKNPPPVDVQLVDRQELDQVLDFMDQYLEPKLRNAVLLVADERSYEEAAAQLNIPVGTIKSRLHRGRGRLREVVHGAP